MLNSDNKSCLNLPCKLCHPKIAKTNQKFRFSHEIFFRDKFISRLSFLAWICTNEKIKLMHSKQYLHHSISNKCK